MTDALRSPHDIVIDKDVEITLRDGVRLRADIFRPHGILNREHAPALTMRSRDGVGSAPYTHYSADYNTGQNTIYTGGTTPSHLLLPIIPIKSTP